MNDSDKQVFIMLFNEACENCFGFRVSLPISEPDCKYMSNKILEKTGLVIGAKSLRNYSFFVSDNADSKAENPSVATLDTLARYVLDAPVIDEATRQEKESDYPYWFWYRKKRTERLNRPKQFMYNLKKSGFPYLIGLLVIIIFVVFETFFRKEKNINFSDNFTSVNEDSLYVKGWMVRSPDTLWWPQRNQQPGHLSLFTLRGDNWPLGMNKADIQNLLARKITNECFSTEVHLNDFIPSANWQQAGILLSENLSFTGKMLRISISYNDFFGGYNRPPEILVQVVSSALSGSRSKPEEVAHQTLFSLDSANRDLAVRNLSSSALKIEKNGQHFRFLYSTGTGENFSFVEIASRDYNFNPKYISLFGISGWADTAKVIPVAFDTFSISPLDCK